MIVLHKYTMMAAVCTHRMIPTMMVAESLLLLLFSSNVVIPSSTVSKCCPLDYELSSTSIDEVDRRQVMCTPTTDNGTLHIAYPTNLRIGLPNCTRLKFISPYAKSRSIWCVDRVSAANSIFGVACAHIELPHSSYIVPPISNIRKCCPRNRKYDAEQQFCWNRLASNYSNALADVLKLVLKPRNSVLVNVSFGAPSCRSSDAILDLILHSNRVHFTKSDALRINNSGDMLLSLDEYCVDVVDDLFEYLVVRSCRDHRIACKPDRQRVCVRKCCPPGHEITATGCVPSQRALSLSYFDESGAGWRRPVNGIRPAFLYGIECDSGKYPLRDDGEDGHFLRTDGQLAMVAQNKVLGIHDYCVENIDGSDGTKVFLCFREWRRPNFEINEFKRYLTTVSSAVSAFFLLMTFAIYASLPSLRNRHCRLIMCYLITSTFSYTMIVVQNLWQRFDQSFACLVIGYLMLFAFLSSFSWLNIISYDIWSTFRAVRSSFLKKSKTNKRFSICCLYGWGFSAIWTAVAAFCQFTPNDEMPSIFKPDIGKPSCWFSNYGTSKIPFFIVPVSSMIIYNLVLFIITVRYCANIKAELQMSPRSNSNYSFKKYTADMNEFVINMKLFILMGINWSMELISLTVQPHNRIFFIVSDLINALEGIIIFCLFVMKKKVLRNLKTVLCGEMSSRNRRENTKRCTTSTSSSTVQSIINSRRSVSPTH